MFGGLFAKRWHFLLPNLRNARDFRITHLLLLNDTSWPIIKLLSSSSIKIRNVSIQEAADDEREFTISYLIKSFGFPPATAKLLSKSIKFETPEKADSVVNFLKCHGFTDTQISKLVRSLPTLLNVAKPNKIFLPKLEFLRSVGVLASDLPTIISHNPMLLRRSLDTYHIPLCGFFKSVFLGDKDDMAFTCFLRRWMWFNRDILKNSAANIAVLRRYGVTQSSISYLATRHPTYVCCEAQKFDEVVNKIVGMGFNPLKLKFVQAIIAVFAMSESTWRHKIEIYQRWGWSEGDTLSAFKKHPLCMIGSEKKITRMMTLLVNNMGWEPAAIARVPAVLCYSLENRIIPRCSVIRLLQLKGLVEDKPPLSSVLVSPEKLFVKAYVTRYQEQVPKLMKIYEGEMSLSELGVDFEGKSGTEQT